MIRHQMTLLLLSLLAATGAPGAHVEQGKIYHVPAAAHTVVGLVPPGWRVAGKAEGDLNGDHRADAVLVLFSKKETEESSTWELPRLLVIALRGRDGLLHRALVSDSAILTHGEGGILGDPFSGIAIRRGTLVIDHYGGSRDRWTLTRRYRLQNGAWVQIGATTTASDTLDLSFVDTVDTNLLTGYSIHNHEKDKEHYRRQYFTLRAGAAPDPPHLDGRLDKREWPGPTVYLPRQAGAAAGSTVNRRAPLAAVSGVTSGDSLFLAAAVTGLADHKPGSMRVITKGGRVILPSQIVTRSTPGGWIMEARFPLLSLGVKREQQAEGAARLVVEGENGPTPAAPLTIEITAGKTPRQDRVLFSTSLNPGTHEGVIVFGSHPGLPLLGESSVFTAE